MICNSFQLINNILLITVVAAAAARIKSERVRKRIGVGRRNVVRISIEKTGTKTVLHLLLKRNRKRENIEARKRNTRVAARYIFNTTICKFILML